MYRLAVWLCVCVVWHLSRCAWVGRLHARASLSLSSLAVELLSRSIHAAVTHDDASILTGERAKGIVYELCRVVFVTLDNNTLCNIANLPACLLAGWVWMAASRK